MDEKKIKKWQICLIIILLIIVILLLIFGGTLSRVQTLSSINNKIESLEYSTTNVYKKVESESPTIESYILGDKRKDVRDGETVQIVSLGTVETGRYMIFPNPVDNGTNFFEMFEQAQNMKIKTVDVNGKDCYELTETNYTTLRGENVTPKQLVTCVEKETGLVIKEVETVIENGTEKVYTTTISYEFNVVTNEDMQ